MSDELDGIQGAETTPAPTETAPIEQPTAPVDPSGEAAPTGEISPQPQEPAMVPSHRLREVREQGQQALQQAQRQWQQQHETAVQQASQQAAQQAQQQWEKRVAAAMGVTHEQTEDPKVAALRDEIFKVVPGLKDMLTAKQPKLEESDAFKQMQQQLEAHQTADGERAYRFGVERRNELQALAKTTLGKEPTEQQQQLLTATLVGIIRTHPNAEKAFYNDPNFIRDFWTHYSGSLLNPQQKAQAAATKAAASQPAGPQSAPGGANVQTTNPPKMSVDDKLKLAHAELMKKHG